MKLSELLKAANVKLLGFEPCRGDGMHTIKVTGGVEAVKAAVAAAQAAAGQEKDKADAGTVHGAAGFHGMNQTGDGAFSVRIMVLWKNLRHPFVVRVSGCGRCG